MQLEAQSNSSEYFGVVETDWYYYQQNQNYESRVPIDVLKKRLQKLMMELLESLVVVLAVVELGLV